MRRIKIQKEKPIRDDHNRQKKERSQKTDSPLRYTLSLDEVSISIQQIPALVLLHDPLRPHLPRIRTRLRTRPARPRPRRRSGRRLQQLAEVHREARRGRGREQRARRMRPPTELGRAAYGPEVAEDVAGVREGHVDGLRVREVADVVEEHGECGRERAARGGGAGWGAVGELRVGEGGGGC